LFSILENDYGIQIGHADEEVDATTVDAQTARLLEIPMNAAVLRIRQKIYSTTGRPALYVLGLYRSDRHSLFIRRFR
jgi:GntR family transcriptional regulator